ncbi:MAG TPA: ABC transporter ATP-binding protein [Actinomycetes bacterium]|nr:ABC transporter ATP-binding protein [Actinomycetes bacterium]
MSGPISPAAESRVPSATTGTAAAVSATALQVDRGGRRVLHDLAFVVPRGSVTGLVGPNACGKTTLLRSIVGVQRVRAGTLTVLGLPAGSPAFRSRIGYLTQAPSVYADLTVGENLRYFAAALRAPSADVDRVLGQVDLTDQATTVVGRLSGGQRARASLAVALLGAPELLVLDEPTVGLDPVLRRDLWNLFHDLAGEGTTLLVSSHVMDEAARCERLLLMRDGRLLAEETPAQLRRRTGQQDLEQAFLTVIEEARG